MDPHSDTPLISVIIINFNAGPHLQAAVDSLKSQSFRRFELIILDNASEDGSAESIDLSGLPQVRVSKETENHGFSGGNNLAAGDAKGQWLALLNPDAMAAPDWLEQLLVATRQFPGIDMFASAQISAEDETILDGAGDAYFVFGLPWRGGFGRPASEMPAAGECFSACGASTLIRKTTFEALGGFDERFFCYCEDVDLGFRLRLRGGRCRFVPEAVVRHAGSAITGRRSDFTMWHGTRNRMWTYLKNTPPLALALTLPGHMAVTLYLFLRGIGKPYHRAMRGGIAAALKGLAPIWRSRREIAATRRVGSFGIMRAMDFNIGRMLSRRAHVWQTKADRPAGRQAEEPSAEETPSRSSG